MELDKNGFFVVLLGVLFDPEKKKILIMKRENDPHIPELSWVFPGGRAVPGKDVEETLKKRIKEQTGLDIENLGCIVSRIPEEKDNFLLVYYLCEVVDGKKESEKLKWVNPEELEQYFTTSFHPHLREYILNLK